MARQTAQRNIFAVTKAAIRDYIYQVSTLYQHGEKDREAGVKCSH